MHNLCHWEIPATDLKRSADFYAQLFGWKMTGLGSDYVMFEIEGGTSGGIFKVGQMPEPCIDVYIKVKDIPATLKMVEELGGRIEKSKTEIGGGFGYYGFFRNLCGCPIGIWSRD